MNLKSIFYLMLLVFTGCTYASEGKRSTSPLLDVYTSLMHDMGGVVPARQCTCSQVFCNRKNVSRAGWFTAGGVLVGALLVSTSICLSMKSACQEAEANLGQCNSLLKEISKISALVCKMDPSLCKN